MSIVEDWPRTTLSFSLVQSVAQPSLESPATALRQFKSAMATTVVATAAITAFLFTAASVSNAGGVVIGNDYGNSSSSTYDKNNQLVIACGSWTNLGSVFVGRANDNNNGNNDSTPILNNSLIITNSGTMYIANGSILRVGLGSHASNNTVFVGSGGLLQANSMIIVNPNAGNTITNSGGIYQFSTPTPTLTPNGSGGIALNGGTIHFTGINNADVSSSQGAGALANITYSGNNAFMLNAASNTTAGQSYTFDSVANTANPSNYQTLVMVNGQTAYRGGDVTIGSGGALLISNTFATFSGLVTNPGVLTLQNSFATINSGLNITGSGDLNGNGTLIGPVNVATGGTLTPGPAIATMIFSNNLTLPGSYNPKLDGTSGNADLIIVAVVRHHQRHIECDNEFATESACICDRRIRHPPREFIRRWRQWPPGGIQHGLQLSRPERNCDRSSS